jgi:hypothetical protein
MDASEIEVAFGKTEDSPELKGLMAKLGVTKRPKLVDGVGEVKFPKLGLRLAFKPEGPKSSKLMLSGITFHSGSEDEYEPFAGALPKGLTLADGRAATRSKLGQPTKAVDRYHIDHWDSGEHRLSVESDDTDNSISKVYIGFQR